MVMIRGLGVKNTTATGAGGGNGIGNITWRRFLSQGTDLKQTGALVKLQQALTPVFAAGKDAFARIPLVDQVRLAKATHNSYFEGADKGVITNPASWACDPTMLTPGNSAQLRPLLTEAGQIEADKFVSGLHIGKAFIVPVHILPDKVSAFLAFFGKTDASAVASLQELVTAGNAKKKVLNNQAMSWEALEARCRGDQAIYEGEKADAMLAFEASLQVEAILDSAITMAALELGLIAEADSYSRYHELWATHNDWQAAASANYRDLERNEQKKDDVILDGHRGQLAALRPVTDAIKAVD